MKVQIKTKEEMPNYYPCCDYELEASKNWLGKIVEVYPNVVVDIPTCPKCGYSQPQKGFRWVINEEFFLPCDYVHLDEGMEA